MGRGEPLPIARISARSGFASACQHASLHPVGGFSAFQFLPGSIISRIGVARAWQGAL
jgi:hypothetical protein